MIPAIEAHLMRLRKCKPLILNCTNYVTMDFMANSLLAMGAAPMMSVCPEEIPELVAMASAININLGTLDSAFVAYCVRVVEMAQKHKKPVLLDPVGAGASNMRTQSAKMLMPYADVMRGNASEIIALAGDKGNTLGVESTCGAEQAYAVAADLAKRTGSIIVVSGDKDLITDGKNQAQVPYGSKLMARVTGMGCAMTATLAAFVATSEDYFAACVRGAQYFALCGMQAASVSSHAGTFRTCFIDALHAADFEKLGKLYAQ